MLSWFRVMVDLALLHIIIPVSLLGDTGRPVLAGVSVEY